MMIFHYTLKDLTTNKIIHKTFIDRYQGEPGDKSWSNQNLEVVNYYYDYIKEGVDA